jgi:DNA polymerase-3 subunit delta
MEEGTALVLLSDELKLAAALDEAVPKANRQVFYELFENEKSEWIRDLFRREGRSIDPGGIDVILEMVQNNTDALRRECTRLMHFLPRDRPAGAEDIEQWLSHNREESAFTLFSRIASGDVSKAIETLHTLLAAKESPPGILAGLAWCFRKLRDYLSLRANSAPENGEPSRFELTKIGISSPKAQSDYRNAARRFNAPAADACLALTAEYDILTRASGAALESILMDTYILKIMQLRGLF